MTNVLYVGCVFVVLVSFGGFCVASKSPYRSNSRAGSRSSKILYKIFDLEVRGVCNVSFARKIL